MIPYHYAVPSLPGLAAILMVMPTIPARAPSMVAVEALTTLHPGAPAKALPPWGKTTGTGRGQSLPLQ